MKVLNPADVVQRTLAGIGPRAGWGKFPDSGSPRMLSPQGCRHALSDIARCALLRAVKAPLRDLVDTPDNLAEFAEEVLEAIIAHGDLLELPEVVSSAERR